MAAVHAARNSIGVPLFSNTPNSPSRIGRLLALDQEATWSKSLPIVARSESLPQVIPCSFLTSSPAQVAPWWVKWNGS